MAKSKPHASLEDLKADILEHKIFAFDLETSSLVTTEAQIEHIAVAGKTLSGAYRATEEVKLFLADLLANPALTCLVHNAPYDLSVVHYTGLLSIHGFRCKLVDTLVLAWLVDENADHGLKESVSKYCGIKMTTYKDVTASSKTAQEYRALGEELAAMEKALIAWRSDTPKRPWPDINSKPCSVTTISRRLKQQFPDMRPADRMTEAKRLMSSEEYNAFLALTVDAKKRINARRAVLFELMDEDMRQYARADAANLFKLLEKLLIKLKYDDLMHILKVEMAVRLETIVMRITGMPVDQTRLQGMEDVLTGLIQDMYHTVVQAAGKDINPKSPKQLQSTIYRELKVVPPVERTVRNGSQVIALPKFSKKLAAKIEPIRRSRDSRELAKLAPLDVANFSKYPPRLVDQLSTDSSVLERLEHPIGQAILDYRTAEKLKGTYVTAALERLRTTGDGRLHGAFNSVGTVSGRFASSDPNLQQIPSRGKAATYHEKIRKLGPRLRELFVAPPPDEFAPEGYYLLVADHSQVELRLITHFTGDRALYAAYSEGIEHGGIIFYTRDIHTQTAELVDVPRSIAKNLNFGLCYGMSGDKFARTAKLMIPGTTNYDVVRATDLRDRFFGVYQGLRDHLQYLKDQYKSGVETYTTIAKRLRRLEGLLGITGGTILNYRVQGSSADIIKYCIYMIQKHVYPRYPGVRLIGQVHDEVIYIIPKRFADEVGLLIKYALEYAWFDTAVPILASAKLCESWAAKDRDDLPEIGDYLAVVDGKPEVFNASTWKDYIGLEEAKRVTTTCTVARLNTQQLNFCQQIIPDDRLSLPRKEAAAIMSRTELLAKRHAN